MYQEGYEKIYAVCERIGNSVDNVAIYRFQFFRKFTDNFPNMTNISRSSTNTSHFPEHSHFNCN